MADMITVFIENENMLAKESNREFRITLRETSTIRELYQQICETAKIKLGFVALSIIDDKTLPPDSNNKLKDHDIVANSTIKLRDMMITVFIRRTAPKIDKDQNDIDVKPNNQITMVIKKILTVKELYQKVCERVNFDLDKLHLIFNNSYLRRDDDATIEYYHITTNSNITIVHLVTGGACRKHYQIGNRKIDASVRFSTGTCVLLLVNDDDISKRVEMPCGHAVTPDGLAEYVDAEIKKQKTKIICPVPECHTEWNIFDIIKRGLTAKERENLEIGITTNILCAQGVQECLKCCAYIQRKGNRTRMECPNCKQSGIKFEFCWSCQKQWKNSDSYSNCGNTPCDPEADIQEILRTCPTKNLNGVIVPQVRACPHCKTGIKHIEKCKQMECPSCKTVFCFICLSVKNGQSLCGSACIVAPRQKL